MRLTLTALLGLLVLTACQSSPHPTPVPTLSVQVSPDPVKIGQELKMTLEAGGQSNWQVALFVEDPDGEVSQLLPNRLSPNFSITAQAASFPPAGYSLLADGPAGESTLLMMVTPDPPELDGISQYRAAQDAFPGVLQGGKGTLITSTKLKLQALNGGSFFQTTKFTVINP